MKVKIEILGELELSDEDFKVLKKVSPENVVQTLLASGNEIQVSIRKAGKKED